MIYLSILIKERTQNMDKNEIKSKISRGFTIALPIILVAILAMLIVVAMDMAGNEPTLPVGGSNVSDSTTSSGADEEPEPPISDPSSKGLLFTSNGDGTCSLDGIGECTDAFIIVPVVNEDGDIVVEVGGGAFKNCNTIKGIELPNTLKKIGTYAFYGSCVKEIIIPSSVLEIGNYALSGCKYLTKIEVEEGNDNYSSISGVLYNEDGTTLICYPAGKTDNFVNISRDVTQIANMAFYRCSSIKKVNYHGTSRSWEQVEIGAGNDIIDEAFIYCAGDSGK